MTGKLLVSLFLFFVFKPVVYAQKTPVILVNQLRGQETCCQPGNSDLWDKVTSGDKFKNLPIGWALRYDAISAFPQKRPSDGEFGLLLEVTPQLAGDSGVLYRGLSDGTDWYKAKNVFLIGYNTFERKKIIDTLFAAFKKRFGYYPSFTSGWMVDAWSLSYLSNKYSVVFHELTKEQYEIDSYTLYGGVFNAAYYPSKKHPLIAARANDKMNIVMARQGISDLIYNYGSPKTVYTSQPNDYLSDSHDKKDISYFKELVTDTVNQNSGASLGVIGFENSFDWKKFGDEYLKQLEYLLEISDLGQIDFYTPTDFAVKFQKEHSQNPSFYLIKDFKEGQEIGVLWYFGENYRARLMLKGGRVILDDLRNTYPLNDPYGENPAASDYAYWIIPYLFDGSQQYQLSPDEKKVLQNKGLVGNTVSDVYTSPFGIVLGQGTFELIKMKDSIEIIFKEGQTVKLLPNQIAFGGSSGNFRFNKPVDIDFESLFSHNELMYGFDRHFNFSMKRKNSKMNLGWQRDNSFMDLFSLEKTESGFSLKASKENDISFLDPIFQPDRSNLPVDPGKSVFYWNNRSAVAGRNPLRLFILPLNTIGRPTQVKEVRFDSEKKELLNIFYPADYSFRVSPWFADITSDVPVKTSLSITVDGAVIAKNIPVEFITDCRKSVMTCLGNQRELLGYISYLMGEQFMMISEKVRRPN